MKNVPKISESEWKVMKVIWAKSPIGAYEIISSLSESDDWHPKTVKTFLSRLVKKRALKVKKDGNAFLYSPLVTEAQCAGIEAESFLERIFGGSLKPMVAHFLDRGKLSEAEAEELKQLFTRKRP